MNRSAVHIGYPSKRLQASMLEPGEALERFGQAWEELSLNSDASTCFTMPGYFRHWWRVLSKGVETRVLVVTEGEHLLGVLPLVRAHVWRGPSCAPRVDYLPSDRPLAPRGYRFVPLRQLSTVASWPAVCLRPTLAVREPDRAAVAAAAAAAMTAQEDVDVIVLPVEEGPDAKAWMEGFYAAGLAPRLHRLHRSLYSLQHVKPFDDLVAGESRNFRKNVRRARAAAEEAGLDIDVVSGHGAVGAQLNEVARVARESWKQGGRGSRGLPVPYEGRQQAFFESVIGDHQSGFEPVLATARQGGRSVAVLLALRQAAVLSALLIFRSEAIETGSPGLLLVGSLLDWGARNGVRRYDLNATQDWLRHISDTQGTLANVVVFRPTFMGRAGATLSRLRRLDRLSPNSAEETA